MTVTAQDARSKPTAARTGGATRALGQLSTVVALSALLGAATSFAQTFLPDALRPFADSASG